MEVESYQQHQCFKETIHRFVQALPAEYISWMGEGFRGSASVRACVRAKKLCGHI